MIARNAAIAAMLSLMMAIGGAHPCFAQIFGNRPIVLVVPYAAGGPTDVIARLLADHMGKKLQQVIVIENVAGAGGTTGAERIARAPADGSALLIHHLALVAAPGLYNNLRYDTKTAFQPIGLINEGPMVLVGRKDLPVSSGTELTAWLRANGGKTTFGHAGVGTNQHLCGEVLRSVVGFTPTYVPYRGAAPLINDLLAGQIDMTCDQSTNAIPQIENKTIKAFALTARQRLPSIGDVPTTAEIGLPQVLHTVWHGLYAPKGTPPDLVAQLNAALRSALSDPVIVTRLQDLGTSIFPAEQQTVEAHARLFDSERERIDRLLKASGVAASEAR